MKQSPLISRRKALLDSSRVRKCPVLHSHRFLLRDDMWVAAGVRNVTLELLAVNF